jgi:hypothetical protein
MIDQCEGPFWLRVLILTSALEFKIFINISRDEKYS